MTTPARSALAIALGGMLFARTATAQPAVPPAAPLPPPATTAPEVQYDTYIEPFDDDPVDRLHNIAPMPPPTPLFDAYDPLEGLDQHAKTSRVVRANQAIFALPAVTVHAGQEFDAPFIQVAGTNVVGLGLTIQFDPAVVRFVDAAPAEWKSAFTRFNATPEHIDPERRCKIVEVSGDPWFNKGSLMNIRLKAIAAGESRIEAKEFDFSDNTFNPRPALVRDGLVRVLP